MTDDTTPTPFHDLDQYLALPRMGSLALSRDGTRLVVEVSTLDAQRTAYRSALWQVDPFGERPAFRLTRSEHGESSPVFTGAGDLLFTSRRGDSTDTRTPPASLWCLPGAGGEAKEIATAPGGLSGVLAASAAPIISVTSEVLASATSLADDATLREVRESAKVEAILHTGYPVRHWDHDLGPATPRRFVGDLTALTDAPARPMPDAPDIDGGGQASTSDSSQLTLRLLAGGAALRDQAGDLSSDGTVLVTTWQVSGPGVHSRSVLVAIDTATGARRTLVDDPGASVHTPVISPDMSQVAYVRSTLTSSTQAPEEHLGVVGLYEGEPRLVAQGWDRWPTALRWLPDGSALVVTADDDGRGPIFLVTLGEGDVVERLTADDAAFTEVLVAPDASTVYAMRTSYAEPPHPVRIDLAAFGASGPVGARRAVAAVALGAPVVSPDLPGVLVDVESAAVDGTRVRGWLAVPHGADAQSPAPLLLWIHGGPLSSWNAWSWRWNPWLAVAAGYAVLLPDPALSTGYGREFIQRGWGSWGAAPYTDLMAITDHVEAFAFVDAQRTAAMGGSFGGYMANWIAGHTDRFAAIVTHASLWALEQFRPTTDHGDYWRREMTVQMAQEHSPHHHVGQIRTPMLVVHGDRDYRVPIAEGLRLWYELLADSGLPADDNGESPHRFLYFPNENHWVLSPQHAKVWYQVVFAFLAENLPGVPPATLPRTLG